MKHYFLYKFIFLILIFNTAVTATRILPISNKLQKYSLAQLKKMHDDQQRYNLFIAQNYIAQDFWGRNETSTNKRLSEICTDEKLITLFLLIQKKMYFPKIIPLFKSSMIPFPAIAMYNPENSMVIFSSSFFNLLTPAQKCSILLHELRHHQQFLAGFQFPEDNELRKKSEHDADSFAAHAMPCFICRGITALNAPRNHNPKGYFCKKDYEPYIQEALQKNQRCKLHKNIKRSDFEKITYEIDRHHKSLKDYLPRTIKPLPFLPKF